MPSVKDIGYETPMFPRQVRLDTTTDCNAVCLSCHRFKTERTGMLPHNMIATIINDIAKWETPLTEIVPVNYGELFLAKDWAWILEMIARKLPNTKIVIPTNGSKFDDKVVLQLAGIPNLHIINFSINAYFDETYKNFTGLKPDTIIKIRKAMAQFRVLRPDITLWASMVFDPEYQTDLERDEFIKYWIGVAQPQILPAASANRGKPIHHPVQLPCRSIFSDIVVGFDGRISSCCFDPNFSLDLGYYDGSIKDCWNSKELTELRRVHNAHKRPEIPICSCCTYA